MQQLDKNANDDFNNLFSHYKSITDKHKSLYIFIINHVVVEDVIEKIKRMIVIIDSGTNSSKNTYRKNRISIFLNFLLGIKSESFVDGVFILGTTLDKFSLKQYWKDTIDFFDCAKIIETHNDYFDIKWLRNLLLDRTFVNILHIKNNTLKHTYLSQTKKKFILEKTEKSMDINLYISQHSQTNPHLINPHLINPHLTNTEIYIVHGVSSFLRFVSETEKIHVLNGEQKDDTIIELIEHINNEKNTKLLKSWIDKMSDIKECHKLVFGSEIKINIENQMLQTIFASPERAEKILINFPNYDLENKIIIVKSFQTNDVGYQLATHWKGAIGIKYY
jgi:hypothetical protein